MGLRQDPAPWLMEQEGPAAVRTRRAVGLAREGDEEAVEQIALELAASQRSDGSFEGSVMKTAAVLNLFDDLGTSGAEKVVASAILFLIAVLESQPGYGRAASVVPGGLTTPCDLCGFFGPYEERADPDLRSWGAREMNFYRDYEPLLGPKTPVRAVARSTLDRPGPGSCFEWGLIPLSYTLEALCRAGYGRDRRIQPAIKALLGAQRESGGWCRSLGGHPSCSIHAVRALGAHPNLRASMFAERALGLIQAALESSDGKAKRGLRGSKLFAAIQAAAASDLPVAREVIRCALQQVAPRQRKNGTFGTPNRVERVGAVLAGLRALETAGA